MASVNDFIQTYMMIENIKNTRQQLAMQATRDKAGALSIMDSVLSNITDADARNEVIGAMEVDFGFRPGQLASLATHRRASGAAQQAGAVEEGLGAMPMEQRGALENLAAYQTIGGMTPTGMQLEQRTGDLMLSGIDQLEQQGVGVDQAMAMRQLFGQTPGQFAVDQQAAGLPQPELQEAAGIGLGTRASAGDVLGATTQAAGIRASQQGNMLDYTARLAAIGAQSGDQAAESARLSAKDLSDDIISITGQLREGGMGGSGEDFLQRNLASRVVSLLNHPLNPYPDVYPGNPRPGETQEQHFRRAASEVVERITGQRMSNDKTFWESIVPGGR